MSATTKAAKLAVGGGGAVLALGASLVTTTTGPAGAATFTVTTNADSGAGSLRQAIADANANPGPDTVTFEPYLQIQLTSGQLVVDDDVTIVDPTGAARVDAGGTSRIFYIQAAGAVTISGLWLADGLSTGGGGAVRSSDTDLTVVHSTISGSVAAGPGGGLAAYGGTLSVDSTEMGSNESTGGNGGGLHAHQVRTVSLTRSTFTTNRAASDGGGISIYDFEQVTESVTVSDVISNHGTAGDQAGGLVVQGLGQGTVAITGSTFYRNEGANGGGVTLASFRGSVDVAIDGSSRFMYNRAEAGEGGGSGGGLYLSGLDDSTVHISTSTFAGNHADEVGGGINLDAAGTVTIETSSISANTADIGGGVASSGTELGITNSTISGNTASERGGGGAVYGLAGTDIAISHSTIAGNTAAYGGGLLLGGEGTATLDHDLIDGNVIVAQQAPQATEPTFDDEGSALLISVGSGEPEGQVETQDLDSVTLTNNLVNGAIAGVVVDGGGNLFDLPANLGPLADNGGPTETHDLLAGSAALDAGAAAFAPPPATDQRGLPRVSNGRIDIGAVEVQAQIPVDPEPNPAEPVPADPTFTG